MRSFPYGPRSSIRARPARTVPTSTGGGMLRPRPLAASRPATAAGLKASAPSPYTVSVGSTMSSPRCTAATASAIPAARSDASAQSYRRLMAAHPATDPGSAGIRPMTRPRSFPHRRDEPVQAGQVLVVAGLPPAPLLGEGPVDRAALLRAMLDGHQAPGTQQPARGRLDCPDRVQPVGTAPQRAGRVVLAHFRGHPGTGRDIRRIADHQVRGVVEPGERAVEVAGVQDHAAGRMR